MRSYVLCAGLAGLLCLSASASAAIVGSTGQVQVISAPGDAQLEALTSADWIRAWNEQQDFVLTNELGYDAVAPGVYDQPSDLGNFGLAAGTRLASHYIHFDSPGSTAATAEGTVTFSHRIIAVICRGDNAANLNGKLDRSDFLGAPTLYSDNVEARGLELGANADRFVISPNGKSIGVRFGITFPGDYVRVLTEVPAPSSAMTAFAALGLLGRRRRP
ncbi:MAG: hypothetical protein L6Q35_15175 [Phycisphaerales bacterium]|nr:hypothetical protein [Phycisphaerales bacterium]